MVDQRHHTRVALRIKHVSFHLVHTLDHEVSLPLRFQIKRVQLLELTQAVEMLLRVPAERTREVVHGVLVFVMIGDYDLFGVEELCKQD